MSLLGIYPYLAHLCMCVCVAVCVFVTSPHKIGQTLAYTDHNPIDDRIDVLYSDADEHLRAMALYQMIELEHELGLLAACSIVLGQ